MPQKGREAGGMTWRQVDILIHVENVDLRPVDPAQLSERFQKGELRVPGGDDDTGNSFFLNGCFDDFGGFKGSGLTHILVAVIDADVEFFDD
jgi:hypothetical protein